MSEPAATPPALDPEDAKIITLARAAFTRAYVVAGAVGGLAEGAAARDDTGRTYAAATVGHIDPALATSALRGALVTAVSSGARRFEAFALVAAEPALGGADDALLADLAAGVPVLLATPDGTHTGTTSIARKA